jgi:hypothetical protein
MTEEQLTIAPLSCAAQVTFITRSHSFVADCQKRDRLGIHAGIVAGCAASTRQP